MSSVSKMFTRARRVPSTYRLWSLRLLSCGKAVRGILRMRECEHDGPVECCGLARGWFAHQAY